MMASSELQKDLADTIGRNFNLVFNQISMYNVYHKSVVSSLERAFESFQDGFKILPTIAISLHQEQLFIEDEALDSRINTNRMTAHFKKADIQSLAFESGMTMGDLTQFLEILSDLNQYPNADDMTAAVKEKGLDKILINYFVYQKIKTDERVVKKDQVGGDEAGGSGGPSTDDILAIMAADILSEEAQKNISVQNLMQGPDEFSQMLIKEDLAVANQVSDGSVQPGAALVQSLNRFQDDVDAVLASKTDVNISELTEDIFRLKSKLIQGIEAQKAQGVVYLDQRIIDKEVDEVADNVLIRLITEEYNSGAVSMKRLAQIILRMTTETSELQRILPKLKVALLNAGMPMSDYLQLVQELKDELQSDELSHALEQSAEAIGLDGEDLIKEIIQNPKGASELIYLAAEIRRRGQDESIMSDILVDYIERIGTELTMNQLGSADKTDGGSVGSVFSKIRTELVDKLKEKDLGDEALKNMEQRLNDRLEESIRHLKSSLVFRQISGDDSQPPTKAEIIKLLRTQSKDEEELKEIVLQVKEALEDKGVDEGLFQEIYKDITAKPTKKEPDKAAPPGSLNRGSTFFVLEKEILRANRYETPFSILSFSVLKASPKKTDQSSKATTEEIIAEFVGALTDIVRETDLVGMLSPKMIVVIQPMTTGENAQIALKRISDALMSREFMVNDTHFEFVFAAAATPFDDERTQDLKGLIKAAQTDLKKSASDVIPGFS